MRSIGGALRGIAVSAAALVATVAGVHVALIAVAITVYPLLYPEVPRVSDGCADLSRADLHQLISPRLERWAQSRPETYPVSDSSHFRITNAAFGERVGYGSPALWSVGLSVDRSDGEEELVSYLTCGSGIEFSRLSVNGVSTAQ